MGIILSILTNCWPFFLKLISCSWTSELEAIAVRMLAMAALFCSLILADTGIRLGGDCRNRQLRPIISPVEYPVSSQKESLA